jgi:hypothetical protein
LPFFKYQWLILRVLASTESYKFAKDTTFEDMHSQLSKSPFTSFSPAIAGILVSIFETACNSHLDENIFHFWGLDSPTWKGAFSSYMDKVDDILRSTIQSERLKSSQYTPVELKIWERMEATLAFVKEKLTPEFSLAIPPMLGGLPFLCPSSITRMLDVLLTLDPLCTLVSSPSTSLV